MKILKATYLGTGCTEKPVSLPEDLTTLRINLSSDRWVEVELFERSDGRVTIRTDRNLILHPNASNSVEIGTEE